MTIASFQLQSVLQVRITPLARLGISESCQRFECPIIGALIGRQSANLIEITDFFVVPHKGISIDKEHFKLMTGLKGKTAPTKSNLQESVIGWFTNLPDIDASWVMFHNFFTNNSVLGGNTLAVKLEQENSHQMKAMLISSTLHAEGLVQFHELPLDLSSFQGWPDCMLYMIGASDKNYAKEQDMNFKDWLLSRKEVRGDIEELDSLVSVLNAGKVALKQ
jgi:JAB1/Mov34/MPN/PAD-1 ubiquitin protease